MRTAAGLAAALALLCACGSDAPASDDEPAGAGEPQRGGTLVIGAPTDIGDIGPLTFQVQNALYMQQFVLFLPLIAYDADLRPIPRLARSWELSADSSSLTFHLRDDVRWHDGTPTTAWDVDFSYALGRDPRTAYIYSGLFAPYGASEVVDSFTWRVALEPHADFMDVWRVFPPSPRHILEGTEPTALRHHPFGTQAPVGNGPFRFVERRAGERWVFEANPDFPMELGGRPYADRLVYRVIPEHSALLTELLTGGIDYYPRFLPENVAAAERSPGVSVIPALDRSWTHLIWNHRRPPFDDRRVRRALTRAIDRERLVASVRGGHGRVANATIAPVFPQYDSTAGADLGHAPDSARALLAEAGFSDGDGDGIVDDADGRPFRFTISVPQGYPERLAAATIVQADVRQVGIDARLRVVEFNTLLSGATDPRRRDFDAMLLAWEPEFRVDDAQLFGCDQTDGPVAFTGWCDPAVDALLDSIARTADPVAARPLWHRYQHRVADAQPVTFLFFTEELHAAGPRLRGARPDARGDWVGIERWWLARPAGVPERERERR